MPEIDKLKDDMVELQSQMAFQEDAVEALNQAIASQQQEILLLRRQLELLKQHQEEQAATSDQSAPDVLDERPPHY